MADAADLLTGSTEEDGGNQQSELEQLLTQGARAKDDLLMEINHEAPVEYERLLDLDTDSRVSVIGSPARKLSPRKPIASASEVKDERERLEERMNSWEAESYSPGIVERVSNAMDAVYSRVGRLSGFNPVESSRLGRSDTYGESPGHPPVTGTGNLS